jgi:PTS system nitrogen regulatory IIA component
MSKIVQPDWFARLEVIMQLTVRDVAGLLEVSEKTVYRWIDDGKLPGYRISGQYRFNRAELLAWATASKLQVSPELLLEPESEQANLPSLEEAVLAGGIHYRVTGHDPAGCLRNVVSLLALPAEVDREFLFQALVARENLSSTGLGHGIAIPHFRNPIVLHLPKPMVSLCFLEKAVDFHALDGEPVSVLFTLICPTVKSHLHLFSLLAFGLRDPAFSCLVRSQSGREEILAGLQALDHRFPRREPQLQKGAP